MSVSTKHITGYVMAGGASRRFGHDKRLVEIDGNSLLDRSRQLLRRFLDKEPICIGDNLAEIISDPSLIVRDASPGCGPLAGLVAALRNTPTQWCLIIAADLPELASTDLERLTAQDPSGYYVVTLSVAGGPEPLAALYHHATADFWAQRLKSNDLALVEGIRRLSWKPVLLPKGSRALDNINSPLDLRPMGGR